MKFRENAAKVLLECLEIAEEGWGLGIVPGTNVKEEREKGEGEGEKMRGEGKKDERGRETDSVRRP